jgi:hypothetical protein
VTVEEMVEKFLCPGCVAGSNTKCGKYRRPPEDCNGCGSHVLGTRIMPMPGLIALGMPKGFNRPGFYRDDPDKPDEQPHHPYIRLRPKGDEFGGYNRLNVAVWALEQDGFLFVRTMMPRLGMMVVDIHEDKKAAEMCPDAINVTSRYGDYD